MLLAGNMSMLRNKLSSIFNRIKNWFANNNVYHQTVIISSALLILTSLCFIPLDMFVGIDLALGFTLGVSLGMIVYFIVGILENKYPDSGKWGIIVTFTRYSVFAIILVILCLMYFKWNIKLFNVFMFAGGYIAVLAIFGTTYALSFIKENKNKVENKKGK